MTHLNVPYVEYKGTHYFLNNQSFRAKKETQFVASLFYLVLNGRTGRASLLCFTNTVYLIASMRKLIASSMPSGFLPPAVAMNGWPPPPPWMNLAASRTSLPALKPASTIG